MQKIGKCNGTTEDRRDEAWKRYARNKSGWPLNERDVGTIDKTKRKELPETYRYYVDDKEVERFAFEPEDGDIFTDGSAYDMDLPTGIAGASACQKTKEG